MELILEEDLALTNYTIQQMKKYKDIYIYGDTDLNKCTRTGQYPLIFMVWIMVLLLNS